MRCCPVWIAQPDTSDRYHRIVVAVDYRPDSPENDALNRQLLEMASSLAHTENAQLHVVHAWRLHGEQTMRSLRTGLGPAEVDEVVNTAAEKRRTWLEGIVAAHCHRDEAVSAPEVHLLRDSASAAVPALVHSAGAELVVMGTVGRTGIPGYFIGNTAETILGRIDCSVLAVKPPGFESPVSME
jgi:nucleotide-binding universal stress UspA family protein